MNSRVTIILVIMAIYLAGMLWIGLKGRKYSETNKDFMTAAKQGSMLLVVGSYLGSHLGNGVVVGGAQYGALYGIGGLWYGAGAALSFVLFALVMSKIVYKKGYLTLPDVLSDRYGGKVVSVLIAILHYCTMIAICAGQIMAGRLLFEYVGLPGTAGAAITFIIVIGYSTMSGLWGVLMTDVVQSSIIFVVTIVGVIWIFAQGGWSVMTANLPATSFQIMPFNAETMIMMFGPSALFGLTSATAFQRTVASKTMKIAFWAPIIASVLVVAYAALPVLMGMYGHALWPEADTSIVFFKLLMEKMPPVMAGLMVACICAAVMYTCDGGLIAGSANIVNDIYLKVINPDGEADQKKLSTITTVSTLVMGILALLISLQFTNLIPLLSLAYSLINAGALIMIVGGVFWKKATKEGAIASFIVGVGLTLLNSFKIIVIPYASVLPLLPALAVFIIVSLITQPKRAATTE